MRPVGATDIDRKELVIQLIQRLLGVDVLERVRVEPFGKCLDGQNVVGRVIEIMPDAVRTTFMNSSKRRDFLTLEQTLQAGGRGIIRNACA